MPLITGIVAYFAKSATSSCRSTRAMTISSNLERTLAIENKLRITKKHNGEWQQRDNIRSLGLIYTSHEIKRHLFLGRKVMTNLDSILKSRDITLSTKVRLVKAVVFPVVMYG